MVVSGESLIEVIAENDEEEIYLTVDGQKAVKVLKNWMSILDIWQDKILMEQ